MTWYDVYPSDDVKQISSANAAITSNSTKVNGGAAKSLGSNRDLLRTVQHGLDDTGDLLGSRVIDSAWVDKAYSGGSFAVMFAERYVIRRVSSILANTTNTVLRSGASGKNRRSINKMENLYSTRTATAIRQGYWNEFSGTFSTPPTTADDINDVGTDEAATPTYAIPGELTYKESKPLPTNDDYAAKTG